MNVAFFFNKASLAFLILFCVVVSFDSAEAERAIRVRKVKSQVAPRHISLSARSGNGIYARRYGYGSPIAHYSTKGPTGRNRKYYAGNQGGRRRRFSKTYASRYRNWVDYRGLGGRNDPRVDRVGQKKKRKELLPFLTEPPLGQKQKRRNRPYGVPAMQRPRPPKKPIEFEEDYFFPEEAKRAETKYEYENRYPRPKKKRRPDFEENYGSKVQFYEEKPYKTKTREPAYSYSSFVQHPSGPSEVDDLYEESDGPYQQPVRSKKKRVKKKSNSRKKNKEQYKPFVFENDQSAESYPPYLSAEEYELPTKTYKKRNKPSYASVGDEDEFVPSTSYSKPRPQVNNLFSTDSDYRGTQNTYQSAQFNPAYSQSWSQSVTTTVRPVQYQTDGGFQPQQYVPSQYTQYSKDLATLQKANAVGANSQQTTYYSQPDNGYKTVPFSTSNQVSSGSNYVYSQPAPSSSPTLSDITIQKSVPIYDNTETFYNFNNNAYVNSQSSKYYSGDTGTKYYNPDTSQTYGNRLTTYRSKDKTDSDSEFIKKHQNLYSKGLTGVPVQGDGYAKDTFKKDYDIGYGDFQFDENPSS